MMLANFSFPTDSVLKLGVVIYYFILVLFGPFGTCTFLFCLLFLTVVFLAIYYEYFRMICF